MSRFHYSHYQLYIPHFVSELHFNLLSTAFGRQPGRTATQKSHLSISQLKSDKASTFPKVRISGQEKLMMALPERAPCFFSAVRTWKNPSYQCDPHVNRIERVCTALSPPALVFVDLQIAFHHSFYEQHALRQGHKIRRRPWHTLLKERTLLQLKGLRPSGALPWGQQEHQWGDGS